MNCHRSWLSWNIIQISAEDCWLEECNWLSYLSIDSAYSNKSGRSKRLRDIITKAAITKYANLAQETPRQRGFGKFDEPHNSVWCEILKYLYTNAHVKTIIRIKCSVWRGSYILRACIDIHYPLYYMHLAAEILARVSQDVYNRHKRSKSTCYLRELITCLVILCLAYLLTIKSAILFRLIQYFRIYHQSGSIEECLIVSWNSLEFLAMLSFIFPLLWFFSISATIWTNLNKLIYCKQS